MAAMDFKRIIGHVVMQLQPLLHQATFAQGKKTPELLSENEIKWRNVASCRIY